MNGFLGLENLKFAPFGNKVLTVGDNGVIGNEDEMRVGLGGN